MKVKPMYWIIIALNIFSCGTAQESPTDQTEIVVKEEPTQVADSDSSFLNIDYLTGKFEPSTQPGFIKIDTQYSDGSEMWMRKDAYEAFLKMYEAAKKDGINLKIVSAARNFNRQKQIWEAKWTGARLVEGKDLSKTIPEAGKRAYKILEYSSMPGTSRHHWGTDIDLNNLEPSWFKSGEGAKIYAWLEANAAAYGFCQPYTKKGASRPHGYNEEHWHWSYQPVASKLTEFARQNLKNEMISGFKGAEAASEIDVVGKYVLGIGC